MFRGYRSSLSLVVGTLAAAIVGACSGGNEDDDGPIPIPSRPAPKEPLVCGPVEAAPAPIRLLTRQQYNNTVAELLGDTTEPGSGFPPENKVVGFENNAGAHQASFLLVNDYLQAAERIAQRAVETQVVDSQVSCSFEGTEARACAEEFVHDFGKRAFRRPLVQDEVDAFLGLYDRSVADHGERGAIQLVVEATLQSPQFLYRVDAIASAPTEETGAVQLGPYQMASRLSYFLWNSMPDDTLFGAADADELLTEAQIETQARRMLDDPRARPVIIDFHRQWLQLDGLDNAVRDLPQSLNSLSDTLMADMRTSLDLFIEHVFWGEGTVEELFTSPTVFVNDGVGTLLGRTPQGGQWGGGDEFHPVDFPADERAGILTQPGLMTLLAHADQSSPVLRGVFIRRQILCGHLPDPPPDVAAVAPDPDPRLSTRERFAEHTKDATCRGCHELIDGLGFGFESYDQLGRFRTTENGEPVDVSGNVAGQGDDTITGEYEGAAELSQKFSNSEQIRDCVLTQWYRFATGRVEEQADLCSMEQARVRFNEAGGNMRELLVALTLTDAFRYRPPGDHDQ